MAEFWTAAGTALGLVLVLEGLFYALAPGVAQKMMALLSQSDPALVRRAGLIALTVGVGIVWLIRGM